MHSSAILPLTKSPQKPAFAGSEFKKTETKLIEEVAKREKQRFLIFIIFRIEHHCISS